MITKFISRLRDKFLDQQDLVPVLRSKPSWCDEDIRVFFKCLGVAGLYGNGGGTDSVFGW